MLRVSQRMRLYHAPAKKQDSVNSSTASDFLTSSVSRRYIMQRNSTCICGRLFACSRLSCKLAAYAPEAADMSLTLPVKLCAARIRHTSFHCQALHAFLDYFMEKTKRVDGLHHMSLMGP